MVYDGIIEGANIVLRSVEVTDCSDSYISWMNDLETNYYMETRWAEQNAETIRAFVESMRNSNNNYLFAIVEKESQRHIGNIKIGPIDERYRYADVSYFIGEKDCHGKGYASEAVKLICKFGFEKLNLHRIQAGIIEGNVASGKVLKKCGFTLEGTFKDKNMLDGNYVDTHLFAIISEK